jgi:hypothetical protein
MAQFTVTSATLTGLTVETGTTLAKGLSRQLVARGTFSDGTTQDLSQNVEWSSSDPSIVSVGSTGLAQAEREGRATLSASAAGVSATGELTVTKATPAEPDTLSAKPDAHPWGLRSIYGPRNLQRRNREGPDGAGDLVFGDQHGSLHLQRRFGPRAWSRQQCYLGKD